MRGQHRAVKALGQSVLEHGTGIEALRWPRPQARFPGCPAALPYLSPAARTFLRVPRGWWHLWHLFVLSLWGKGGDKGVGCEGRQHAAAQLGGSASKCGFSLYRFHWSSKFGLEIQLNCSFPSRPLNQRWRMSGTSVKIQSLVRLMKSVVLEQIDLFKFIAFSLRRRNILKDRLGELKQNLKWKGTGYKYVGLLHPFIMEGVGYWRP